MRRLSTISAVMLLALGSMACGDDATSSSGSSGSIRVFAAASLSEAFTELAEAFEAAHDGTSVDLSFAGSSSLREQILAGAPADVFASANVANMDEVIDAGEVGSATVFATNRLQIAVPAGNPAAVDGLADFADPDLLIGLCAEEVPCGVLGRQALDAAGVTPAPDTAEPDVRALLTKVEAGELDAGLVYVTDVLAAGRGVLGIDLPAEIEVSTSYTIGTVAGSGNADLAAAFVELVRSDEGQAILERAGFERA